MTHNSGEYLHTLIEALQLSFADCQWYCADPTHSTVPTPGLLDKTYAAQRRALMNQKRYIIYLLHCTFFSDKVYIYSGNPLLGTPEIRTPL